MRLAPHPAVPNNSPRPPQLSRITISRRPLTRLILCWIAVVAPIATHASLAIAQSENGAPYRAGECRVTIALPTVRLNVDAVWLRAGMSIPEPLRHGCPTSPVTVDNFYLGRAIMREFKAPDVLGRSDFRMQISSSRDGFSPSVFNSAESVKSSMTMSQYGPDVSVVNDTSFKYARHYDVFYYRYPDDLQALHVTITCNGEAGTTRQCVAGPPPSFSGLQLQYIISQTLLPVPEVQSAEPTTEPGAIFQFDRRLREWLVSLEAHD